MKISEAEMFSIWEISITKCWLYMSFVKLTLVGLLELCLHLKKRLSWGLMPNCLFTLTLMEKILSMKLFQSRPPKIIWKVLYLTTQKCGCITPLAQEPLVFLNGSFKAETPIFLAA